MSARDVFWMTAAERNEYDRQLAELEARIAARAAANAAQVQQLAEWGNVTDDGVPESNEVTKDTE